MSGPGVELAVQVLCDSATIPGDEQFHAWVSAALQRRQGEHEITIRIVDESESQAMNKKYRCRDRPTNVLSFPADLPPGVDHPLLGDLVICAPLLEREATAQGKESQAHWAHLVIHGVLHLLGHDHQQPDEADEMEALETAILASIGYPDPYEHSGERQKIAP
ncbi:MAG: rRNA maturation RNase YbeY [Gammaproteobacteria bacterium]|nr:rRNA maturation RNase YbeY [Gammaproteobacteria bacterium]